MESDIMRAKNNWLELATACLEYTCYTIDHVRLVLVFKVCPSLLSGSKRNKSSSGFVNEDMCPGLFSLNYSKEYIDENIQMATAINKVSFHLQTIDKLLNDISGIPRTLENVLNLFNARCKLDKGMYDEIAHNAKCTSECMQLSWQMQNEPIGSEIRKSCIMKPCAAWQVIYMRACRIEHFGKICRLKKLQWLSDKI